MHRDVCSPAGRGRGLGILTKNIAKPAVPYGGKYRIIDFPLSNCVNSGISTVGVLTQYQPLELNDYIGKRPAVGSRPRQRAGYISSRPISRFKGSNGIRARRTPFTRTSRSSTATTPSMSAVLSGRPQFIKWITPKCSPTIRKRTPPAPSRCWRSRGRRLRASGLMLTDDDNRITEFEEKPKNPRSNKASMGVYIFTWSKLRQYLIDDEANPNSSNDFGKNVIPAHACGGRAAVRLPV